MRTRYYIEVKWSSGDVESLSESPMTTIAEAADAFVEWAGGIAECDRHEGFDRLISAAKVAYDNAGRVMGAADALRELIGAIDRVYADTHPYEMPRWHPYHRLPPEEADEVAGCHAAHAQMEDEA